MRKSVIYETKGRAREFCELALNHYQGCGHQCIYCYGADVTHSDPRQFFGRPRPRLLPHEIVQSADELRNRYPQAMVLLSFVTDPYQPLDVDVQLTRKAIKIIHAFGHRVTILTKGGIRARRDFDLFTAGDAFATTLTCRDAEESLKWEPHAAIPSERIAVLQEAHRLGYETWVSFEPVINPDDVYYMIHETAAFVDHYKVGTMNYHPHGATIDWGVFGHTVEKVLQSLCKPYYLKKDLRAKM